MEKQRIVNWQQQALEIMGAALIKNRSNMSCTMITPTEMIVRCKEDNWKVRMTEHSYCQAKNRRGFCQL